MKDRVVLVAMPVQPGDTPRVQGAFQDRCQRCRCLVWMAPSSRDLVYDELLCALCANDDIERQGGEPFTAMPLTPRQVDELQEAMDGAAQP